MNNQPNQKTVPVHKVIEVHRLSKVMYDRLETKFSKPLVSSQTTAHEAGYQLGIQAVLQHLRQDYVVGT